MNKRKIHGKEKYQNEEIDGKILITEQIRILHNTKYLLLQCTLEFRGSHRNDIL